MTLADTKDGEGPRQYDEAVRFAIESLMGSALMRESHGLEPETNTILFTNSLLSQQALIGFIYRVDTDSVVEDLSAAVGLYGGKVPHLEMPSLVEGSAMSG